MTNGFLRLSLMLLCGATFGSATPALAAPNATTRLKNVVAGQETVVGRHSSWNKKCESTEIPVIKINTPPKHGRIQSGPIEFKPTRAIPGSRNTQCLGKEMTGTALTYVADPKYSGQDEFSYTVHFKRRRADVQKDFTHNVVLNVSAATQTAKPDSQTVPTATAAVPPPSAPQALTTPAQPTVKARGENGVKEPAAVPQARQATKDELQNIAKKQAATSDQLAKVENALGGIVLPAWASPSEWMMRVAAVPIQQQQFCRIVDRFYGDLEQVYLARNEIKQNALYRDRKLDLATLLPAGEFANWVVQVKEVVQAADGSAAVMLQPPCRAMLGSDACQKDPSKIRATISTASPLYRELARVSAGDFVIVSGKLLYAEAANADEALPTYAVYRPGQHCSSTDGAKQEDVFVTDIRYLVQLR